MGCSICLDGYGADDDAAHRPVGLVPCGHVFHQGCLIELLRSGSSRLATQHDVRAHRRALQERRRHPLHLERIGADLGHGNRRNEGGDQGAAAGPSRARITYIVPEEQDRHLAAQLARAGGDDDDDEVHGDEPQGAPPYEFYEPNGSPGLVVPSTPIVVCPLCKSICPIDSILDLWPSEYDDLDLYKQLMQRPGSGVCLGSSRLSRALNPEALLKELTSFHKSISAYVMHSHSVELRLINRSGGRILQLVERLTSYNTQMQELKDAINALHDAAARFTGAALHFEEKVIKTEKRDLELQKLQRILDDKDAKLTRLAAVLKAEQATLDTERKRIKGEKIALLKEMKSVKERSELLESKERDARRAEQTAQLTLKQGLAQRDVECAAKVAEANQRADEAEKARLEAEKQEQDARLRQAQLGEQLRQMVKDRAAREQKLTHLQEKYEALKQVKGSSVSKGKQKARGSTPGGHVEAGSSGTVPSSTAQEKLRALKAKALAQSGSHGGPAPPIRLSSSTTSHSGNHGAVLPLRPRQNIPSTQEASSQYASITSISMAEGPNPRKRAADTSADSSSLDITNHSSSLIVDNSTSLDVSGEDLSREMDDADFPMPGFNARGAAVAAGSGFGAAAKRIRR
ncbi:hypothetical protein V8E36_007226 [Tilletia maclaganii]